MQAKQGTSKHEAISTADVTGPPGTSNHLCGRYRSCCASVGDDQITRHVSLGAGRPVRRHSDASALDEHQASHSQMTLLVAHAPESLPIAARWKGWDKSRRRYHPMAVGWLRRYDCTLVAMLDADRAGNSADAADWSRRRSRLGNGCGSAGAIGPFRRCLSAPRCDRWLPCYARRHLSPNRAGSSKSGSRFALSSLSSTNPVTFVSLQTIDLLLLDAVEPLYSRRLVLESALSVG